MHLERYFGGNSAEETSAAWRNPLWTILDRRLQYHRNGQDNL